MKLVVNCGVINKRDVSVWILYYIFYIIYKKRSLLMDLLEDLLAEGGGEYRGLEL